MNMDVRPPDMNLYRYHFQDLLLDRARAGQSAGKPLPEPLVADIFVSRSAPRVTPPAPQGLGEMKHAPTKRKEHQEIENPEAALREVDGKDDSWLPDTALQYTVIRGHYKPALGVRRRMEREVRRRKKEGDACPYADSNFHCSALFIRCGDRIQYANPETIEQRNLPHDCLYRPKKAGRYILIVDANRTVREFCKNTLELFFNYPGEHIVTAATGIEAIDALNRFKLEGKQCGLLIVDAGLPGISGYDVIGQLVERNYHTDVLLTKEESRAAGYAGNRASAPAAVKQIITKPFHSQTFVNALKSMKVNAPVE